jgi:DNA ligase (NAD+)
VGAAPDGVLEKRPHVIPMGSQRKAMNRGEFQDWLKQVAKGLGQDISELDLHMSYKVDGGSFSFEFRDGVLYEALSRGDGFVGENVTHNAKKFSGIPKKVIHPVTKKPFNGFIRGEVILDTKTWEQIDSEMTSNPRNVGNGISRRKSGEQAELLHVIAFRAYNTDASEIADSQTRMFVMMREMGFDTAPDLNSNYTGIEAAFEELEESRKSNKLNIDYWIDGAVICLDNISEQDELGVSDNRPKGQIALKFGAVGTSTVLEGVNLTVGHTGMISPTGYFTPVQISGTTITNALLVNWDNIQNLDIAIGDSVEIYKAGEIIPKVLRVTHRPENRQIIPCPTECPVCGGTVGKKQNVGGLDSSHMFCLNADCSAKRYGKMKRFIKSINIMGIGDSVLKAMIDTDLLEDVDDLFILHERKTELENLEMGDSGVRLGKKRAQSILDEIDDHRNLTIPELLGSLGIDHLGKRRVEIIQEKTNGKLDDIYRWFGNNLIQMAVEAGIPNIAEDIQSGLNDVQDIVLAMIEENGVNIFIPEKIELSGDVKSFCITGKLSMTKKAYEGLITEKGHIWKPTVSQGLDYLIMADPNSGSAKAVKAKKLGVKCISEEEFQQMF